MLDSSLPHSGQRGQCGAVDTRATLASVPITQQTAWRPQHRPLPRPHGAETPGDRCEPRTAEDRAQPFGRRHPQLSPPPDTCVRAACRHAAASTTRSVCRAGNRGLMLMLMQERQRSEVFPQASRVYCNSVTVLINAWYTTEGPSP